MEELGKNLPIKREPEKHDTEEVRPTLEISESNPIYYLRSDDKKSYFLDGNKHYWVYYFDTRRFEQKQQIDDLGIPDENLSKIFSGLKRFNFAEDAMIYGTRMNLMDSSVFFRQSSSDEYLSEGVRKRAEMLADRHEKLIKLLDEILEEKDLNKREEMKKRYEEEYKNITK